LREQKILPAADVLTGSTAMARPLVCLENLSLIRLRMPTAEVRGKLAGSTLSVFFRRAATSPVSATLDTKATLRSSSADAPTNTRQDIQHTTQKDPFGAIQQPNLGLDLW
jgi:hypothetical protein